MSGLGRRGRATANAFVERLPATASRWLLLGVIVVSALALGSIPPEALFIVTGMATLGAACALFGRAPRLGSLPGPAWLALGLTAYTAVQALALPTPLVGAIAPANRDVWEAAFEVLGEHLPTWLPLSLDPSASWLEAVKGWLYACVFVSAAAVGARRGAGFGAAVLQFSALLLALVCLGHGATEATKVFGLYRPKIGGTGFDVAPLLNPNNRASYLNVGVLCGASLLAMRRPPLSRWLIALCIPPMLGVSLLTGSRGGILGLAGGGLLLFLLLRPRLRAMRSDSIQGKQLLLLAGTVATIGAAFAVVAAGPRLRHVIFEQDASKLALTAAALQLLSPHFWLGIGRGAFESVFPALLTGGDNTVSSHPENFVVQWATEWGVPTAVAALGLLGFLLRPRNWGVGSSIPACGLFCGTASLVIQNLFDLGSEVPGVVVAGVAAAGFAWGANTGKLHRSSSNVTLTLTTIVLGTLLVGLGVHYGTSTLTRDREWLRDQAGQRKSWSEFKSDVRQVILRHPADPYFPRLAAAAAWRSGTQNPLPWIGHAIARGVSAGRSHYLLGGYLASRGKQSQALLELRLAATYDPALSRHVAKLAVKLTQQQAELERSVPEGARGAYILVELSRALQKSDPALALLFLREAVSRDPRTLGTRLALGRRLLDDAEASAGSCLDPTPCLEEVTRLLEKGDQHHGEFVRLRARLLIAKGLPAEAVQLLSDECRRLPRPLPCIATWVDAARRAKDRKGLQHAVTALASEDCSVPPRCFPIRWAAGQAAKEMGDVEAALRYMEQAATEERSVTRWREVASFAREQGQPGRATQALTRARSLDPTDLALKRELDSTRHKAFEQMLQK